MILNVNIVKKAVELCFSFFRKGITKEVMKFEIFFLVKKPKGTLKYSKQGSL